MLKIIRNTALAALLILPTAAFAGPAADVVATFYAQPAMEFDLSMRRNFTDPAKTILDLNDAIAEPGELGCIDFSFVFDAQDFDEAEIARTLEFDERANGGQATVVASFNNFGEPVEIEWTLRKIGVEWKISDVASAANDWRLSEFDCSI